MRRREFIAGILGLAAMPLGVRAQQADRVRRIGVVIGFNESDPVAQAQVAELRQGLQRLGWMDGSNIRIDVRYVGDNPDRIRAQTAELLRLRPDLMVANTNLVTQIVQAEIGTLPLVFLGISDPVGSGFVSNLARPTGNVTGFGYFEPTMGGKWLETLKEIAPGIAEAGFILNPETAPNIGFLKAAQAAAPSLKVKVTALGVHGADDIARSVAAFGSAPERGLIVAPHAITLTNSDLIVEMSARLRLPTIYPFASHVRAGGLISYGVDLVEPFRQGAPYIDRILNGTPPGELPVQHPTRFELAVNMKTAKALGLAVPESFLFRADEVIE
jgi:putative tryptophan/tyrosine transport system substrate-binding protein